MRKSIGSRDHKRLGRILAELREQAGLTQAEVGRRIGEPQHVVSKYEGNHRRLDLVELKQVADALGTTLDEIVRRFEHG